uniref:GOLD domain-containing protein n=1 Tax=Arcella intermedia TaxID=1963864 RepID=A0A6B2LI31_9EUKA
MQALVLLGVVLGCLFGAEGVQFDVEPATKQCISQDFSQGQIIHGTFKVPQIPVMKMTFRIYPPEKDAEAIFTEDDATDGSYAFTTHSDGNYKFCFIDTPREGVRGKPVTRRVQLTAKEAWITPNDDEDTVEKEELEPVQQRFMGLEPKVETLKVALKELRMREARHRDTSESTSVRISVFSVLSILIVVVCGGLQVWHLRRFFKKKKIL